MALKQTPSTRIFPGLVLMAVVALQATTSGCQLFCNAKRTILTEPKRFPSCKNTRLAQIRNAWLASRAWREVRDQQMAAPLSKHYGAGFRCGFAEYLMFGGDAQPPLVPPREYWNLDFETPAGKQAISDWFQGYHHGATECQAQGNRQMTTVPTSLANGIPELIGESTPANAVMFGPGELETFDITPHTDAVPEQIVPGNAVEQLPTPALAPVIHKTSYSQPANLTAPSIK